MFPSWYVLILVDLYDLSDWSFHFCFFLLLFQARREHEFKLIPKWRKFWKILQKRETPEQAQKAEFERKFLHKLILGFIETLDQIPEAGKQYSFRYFFCRALSEK